MSFKLLFPKYLQSKNTLNDEGKLWAVLAAGSVGWDNYRHQADLCHVYQMLKNHGIPDERIIVFMKDDIAFNERNPNQGVIINQPNGPNVYEGVPKDYVGDDLKYEYFLNVLKGKKMNVGSGKTLKTGQNDRIFVFFADHGGPGFSRFGGGNLKATDLMDTLDSMHKENKYNEMVIYWEACESGS